MPLGISSPAWRNGESIPKLYTCDGRDISPPLSFEGAPAGTRAFALVCSDPDAPHGTWVHWVIYNIPGGVRGLREGVSRDPSFPDGSHQGNNSWNRLGYGGPCPPSGRHRYFFRLHALRESVRAGPGLTAHELEKALQGIELESAELLGTYARS